MNISNYALSMMKDFHHIFSDGYCFIVFQSRKISFSGVSSYLFPFLNFQWDIGRNQQQDKSFEEKKLWIS